MEKEKEFSRRSFLKTLGLAGAALTIQPAINKVKAANAALGGENALAMKNGDLPHRTLGTGKAAFEVSALGFGVMGMTYNRKGTGRQDSSRKTVRQYCEDSLRRLKLDSLPMFYQHRADPNTPAEEVAQTIAELMKEGKVQHWGMCEVSAETIRRAHAVCPLTAIQSEYHLMHRDVETNGVLDVCRELGIGFVPYSPINRGFLGGCINEYTVFDPTNDNRQTLPRFQPEAIRANNLAAEEWRELETAVAAIPVVGDRYNAEQQRQVGR